MGKATSLVELILRKWGDDIAGAAKELEEKVGFPESVANRIATGELPMDEASRVARREAQTRPETYYNGSKTGGILEIDPDLSGSERGMSADTGFWGARSPQRANGYAGNPLNDNSTIYPFRVMDNSDQMVVDGQGAAWNNIKGSSPVSVKHWGDGEKSYGPISGWTDDYYDTNGIAHMARDKGDFNSVSFRGIADAADDGNVHVELAEMFPELQKMPYGSEARRDFMNNLSPEDKAEAYRRAEAKANGTGESIVVFDPDDIRSPNAAFDPQYTGPNIMGGAALPITAGLLAGGQSEEADAGVISQILKKWGDDIAGATDELVELGYPESVAKKIADGTLPMDDASREARAGLMNMTDDRLYRGHNSGRPPHSNQDMFMSDSYDNAFTYADAFPYGDVTPLRHNAKDLAYVNAGGKSDRAVTTNNLKNPGIRRGVIRGTDDIVEAVKYSDEYQGTHFKGIRDDMHNSSSTERANVYNILGSRPEVKIRHADLAAFDPEYNGPSIMGGAALPVAAGLLAAGQSDDADAGFITKGGKTLLEAWHGSPHKFDKFSMDQIGTGEGAQAYGHGLYFADEVDVAKGYQPRDTDHEQWMYEQYKAAEESGDQYMMDAWERAMMHDSPIELRASAADPDYDEYSQAAFAEVADALTANPGAGSLSKVEIDVTPESLLDWDAMLDEQPKAVQEAIESSDWWDYAADDLWNRESNPTGGDLVRWLSDDGPEFGSQQLSGQGIKGIKYLDGDSRAVGDGTSNYVIFDDSLINIAERGNADPRLLAGTAAGTAGLLAAPMLTDKDKPLPLPTAGDIGESVLNILGLPMTGLQGIARGLFGLATGEGLTEAAAQAGNTMDVGWKDGRVDVSNMNPDRGADQLEGYVTDVTGDPSLGWMAKMGLMLGSI